MQTQRSRTRKASCRLLVICTMFVLIAFSAGAAQTRLTIVHVNDVHGFLLPNEHEGEVLGGAARIMTILEGARKDNPNTLFLAGGDMVTGSGDQYQNQWDLQTDGYRGLVDMQVMNLMGYDAMVLGNHEFDQGKAWLTRMLTVPEFPVLCANIVHRDLPAVGDRDGELIAQPYEVFEFDGVRIAVVGLTTPAYMQSAQTKVLDAAETLRELLPTLRAESDYLVVLSHLGMKPDRELAQALPGEIDVIIGGHSHTVTIEPRYEGDTLIVQTGEYGKNVGVLDLYLEQGDVVNSEFRLVPVTQDIPADLGIQAFIEENLAVGEIQGGSLTWSDKEQSSMGRFVTDAVRWATGADVAIVMSGVAKGDLDEGTITANEFFDVFWPYRARTMGPGKDLDEEQLVALISASPQLPLWAVAASSDKLETIVLVELTGAEIAELIGRNADYTEMDNYLQLSHNLRTSSYLQDDETYRTAVNLTVAVSDFEYGLFDKHESFEFTGMEVFDAVLGYLEFHGPIDVTQ